MTTAHLPFTSNRVLTLIIGLVFTTNLMAQNEYEICTWYGNKTAAVSYTFDDNTGNQIPVALPLLESYQFKATFYIVPNWSPNWDGFREASDLGHEVSSHTVTHPSLDGLSIEEQEMELSVSQQTIREMIPGASCQTIAYPNCNVGDVETISDYYIAGRICSGQIVPASPTDFYRLSSNIVGSAGSLQDANSLNRSANAARNAGGWRIFLLHGINSDGGYSPISSTELDVHFNYMEERETSYWIGTFSDVVKYIRERDSTTLTENMLTGDSIELTVTDNLPDSIYQVPLTIKRVLPKNWTNAMVSRNGEFIEVDIHLINDTLYLLFDAIPDQGPLLITQSNENPEIVEVEEVPHVEIEEPEEPLNTPLAELTIASNPFTDVLHLTHPGTFHYSIYSLDGRLNERGFGQDHIHIGSSLRAGIYLLKIGNNIEEKSYKIIKK